MTFWRYIIREFIPPFVFSLSLIIFLFVLNLLFQMLGRIAGKGLPIGTVLEYFFLNLAWMVALAVPMSVLVGTLSGYARLSSDGEIVALKSSGAGPLRLIGPALFMGILICLLVAIFNDRALPQMNHRARQLQADIRRKKPTMVLEPGVFLSDIPGYVMIARDVNQTTSEVKDVVVYQENDAEYNSAITAKTGVLRYNENTEGFEFLLRDGEIDRTTRGKPSDFQITNFSRAVFRIYAPEMSLRRTDSDWRGERELNTAQLLGRIRQIEKQDTTHGANINKRELNNLKVEVNKKFSIPAACIVFAILGSVLGQWAKKSGLGVSAGYSIFFFLIYWVFLIGGEDIADRGRVAPWLAMWAPNILFMGIALLMVWRERKGEFSLLTDWLRKIRKQKTESR